MQFLSRLTILGRVIGPIGASPTYPDGAMQALSLDETGALRTTGGGGGGGAGDILAMGDTFPQTTMGQAVLSGLYALDRTGNFFSAVDRVALTGDNLSAADTPAAVVSYNLGFDGTNYDRVRVGPANADGVTAPTVGNVNENAFNFGFNGTSFDRLRSGATNADALATGATGILSAQSYNLGFNGTTYDRLRSFAGNASGITAPTLGLLGTATFNLGFNGTTYDRLLSFTPADAQAAPGAGVLGAETFGMGFNGTTWDRLRSFATNADGQTSSTLGVLGTKAFLAGVNGSGTYDRIRAGGNDVNGIATTSTGNLNALSFNELFNGTSWDRARNSSAANQSAANPNFALQTAEVGNWSQQNSPAANTQATTSRAAGGAGVRHVCTSITACIVSTGAGGGGGVINLRDGATGAGTILWSAQLGVPGINNGDSIVISGLSIVGSANTAMTLEFAAAGGANTTESVAMTGYTIA